MKCPYCKTENTKEYPISIFETDCGLVPEGGFFMSAALRLAKKIDLAVNDKKRYICANGHIFEA